jgi:hypothetical protein
MQTTLKDQCCCDPGDDEATCASGSRNRYFRRKVMTAEDFTREQAYMIGRRRQLNRALYGWGVVYGLGITVDEKHELSIGCGLALDRHGREIIVPALHRIGSRELFVRPEGTFDPARAPKLSAGRWLLSAHYAERLTDAVRLADACGCGEQEWNRICETVVFSLTRVSDACCPPYVIPCPHDCGCPEPCPEEECVPGGPAQETPHAAAAPPPPSPSRESEASPSDAPRREPLVQRVPVEPRPERVPLVPPYPRGPDWTLCCWSSHAEVECDDGHLCEWNGLCLDPCDAVPLACVTVTEIDKCGCPSFGDPEVCPPRRLVKRNDMLFDLIRGCDLTRIARISWAAWARQEQPVPWKVFRSNFHDPAPNDATQDCMTGLEIEFSGPVRTDTLRRGVVRITALFRDSGTAWNVPFRAPLARPKCDPPWPGDPPGTTRKMTVVVRRGWFEDEVATEDSKFDVDFDRPQRYATVEIEILGDLILDCKGQQVAANSFGPKIVPTGNCTPGGTCHFSFRVAPEPPGSSERHPPSDY